MYIRRRVCMWRLSTWQPEFKYKEIAFIKLFVLKTDLGKIILKFYIDAAIIDINSMDDK